ncbi:hypothetical protein BP6252_07663 [Lecanosticta acicola]|uniref:Linoleate 8R-lipoxygenase n=1 Tax=Lecanosticta acicola TaxID=111012 RepID=A0AAI8Z142_9PEZI|nr:hypothetical protein BP6252_07663 [Lecanosticta acicola]
MASEAKTLAGEFFSSNPNGDVPKHDPCALHARVLGDLASQADRTPEDLGMLLEGVDTMEQIIQLAASLPSDSPLLQTLSGQIITKLWNGVQHPPLSYVGDEWKYRTADGSNNNKTIPWLGKAGSAYARSVEPETILPPTLPDASLIFDELMAREGGTREHPNKVSSMLFYLATIIVHDIFRTNDLNWTKADNSSYLDLSPLYGNSEESQRNVRTMKDGKLKPDSFSEARLLGFPPGVAALMCSFNRFHNYVADQLSQIDEGGRFTLISEEQWSSPSYAALNKQHGTAAAKRDHDLFNTARLITCGLYVNIILGDYVRTILNLNTTASSWILDPRQDTGKLQTPEAVGNQVSVEFNLVYRWHSAISAKDEKWTQDFLKQNLGEDRDLGSLTLQDFVKAKTAFGHSFKNTDPGLWPLGNLKRQENGFFKSEELVEVLSQATEDCAGSFGARNVPIAMKAIEIMGIEQARKWNVATLNEFREFFGMQRHKTFSDITTQPDVAASLETLYGSPDLVELYPGLIVEDGKPVEEPGSGLCPGYTISRAILSDAVALVRGDRFYTKVGCLNFGQRAVADGQKDYNAATLTNWGYTITKAEPQIAGGGVMYKLLYNAYPQQYPASSIYAMYPFQTPGKTRENLSSLGQVQDFCFDRPAPAPRPRLISSWQAATEVLADHERFKVPWGKQIKDMTQGKDYCHAGDTQWHRDQHKFIDNAVYCPHQWKDEIKSMYEKITLDLIKCNSRKLRNGYQLDIVKDLANPASTLAIAELFHIPLKTFTEEAGILTVEQFHTLTELIFMYIFTNSDECKGYELRQGALKAAATIRPLTEQVVELVEHSNFHKMAHLLLRATGLRPSEDDLAKSFGTQLIQRLIKGRGDGDISTIVLSTLAEGICGGAQGLAQVLDLLHQEKYHHHWAEVQRLARSNEDEELEKYVLECLRISAPVFALPRIASQNTTIQDGTHGTIQLQRGHPVVVNLITAGLDASVFPNPLEIKLDRPAANYLHHGWGPHACIGRNIVTTGIATQLKCLAKCKNLRRTPGLQGQMKTTLKDGMFKVFMKADWSDSWPFPTTMKFLHEGYED